MYIAYILRLKSLYIYSSSLIIKLTIHTHIQVHNHFMAVHTQQGIKL